MPAAKILIVEDEMIIAMDLRSRLIQQGYQVVDTCSTGEEALHKHEQHLPNLILMDMMLQGELNGVDTARCIRQHSDVPVIYLTAYSDESTMARARAISPYGYIAKPFDDEELYATIEAALSAAGKGNR